MIANDKIYFAHSKFIYGTQQEVDEFEFLTKKYPNANFICPHNTVGALNDYKDYLYIVDCCNYVIASEFNGYVGFGVFAEIARALGNNASVSVLRKQADEFYILKVTGLEIINQSDWKNKYGKLIVKDDQYH
jgi:hypothetical protein